MLVFIVAMGFVNLALGVAVAMQLGLGPPNLRALVESLGTMPKANEVAEEYDAAFSDEFMDPIATLAEPVASTATTPSEAVPAPSPVADTTAVAGDNRPDDEVSAVEVDADLANNPLLEQSVLDEVRAMGETLGSPMLAAEA